MLLNDPTYVEAARALAARILKEAPADDEERLYWAWRTVLSREPRSEEMSLLRNLLEKHRAQFADDPAAAETLLSVGISAPAEDVPVAELAAWTSVSRALLNLNETIFRN